MSERYPDNMSNDEINRIFKAITARSATEEYVPTLQDHFLYLRGMGYSDDEINQIFELTLDVEGGEVYEI